MGTPGPDPYCRHHFAASIFGPNFGTLFWSHFLVTVLGSIFCSINFNLFSLRVSFQSINFCMRTTSASIRCMHATSTSISFVCVCCIDALYLY